ncbi:hypothetical protein ACFPT7_01505 [Acidicapsa dinghuensis]|uniref:Uncharacterized protein n=1 Tax=Acidicapsa dinghuensis TaxID=2218256 RepID=A0ABW1E9G7_9BACT|nr:hypothetical protein [Acidicapsa dinghuensis]
MKISPRAQISLFVAAAVIALGAAGCKSKQQQAIDQAQAQAAKTGQPQTITTTDSNGNTVTTTVQPPAPGQKEGAVTTTVTPKPAAGTAASSAATSSGATGSDASASGGQTAGSATPQPAPAPAPPPTIEVAAGTPLTIRINERLSARRSHAGERFTGEVVDPVMDSAGNAVIPKGAPVTGKVVFAKAAGHFKGAAHLDLRLTSLTLNGKEYPLDTKSVQRSKKGKGKRTGAFIGGGTGLGLLLGGVAGGGSGALIGGLAGAGAGTAGAGLTGNRDLVIPSESIVRFKLADDLEIQTAG